MTQEELAKRFGLSRVRVSRLLKRAREDGVVENRVNQQPGLSADLEREFMTRFNIDRLSVSVDQRDPDAQRMAVIESLLSFGNGQVAHAVPGLRRWIGLRKRGA